MKLWNILGGIILTILSTTALCRTSTHTYGHILLSKDLSVAGHLVCQTEDFLYFIDEHSCNVYNFSLGVAPGLPALDCESKKPLAAIKQLEKIKYKKQDFLRFFEVDLEFNEKIFTEFPAEDIGALPVTVIVPRTVRSCNRALPETKSSNVATEREARPEEFEFLELLLKNDLRVINQPAGPLTDFRFINANLDSSFPEELSRSVPDDIQSPQCRYNPLEDTMVLEGSGELSGSGIAFLPSGEMSGSGWRSADISSLQDLSRPLSSATKKIDPKSEGCYLEQP